jgi:DNA-binding transcriptional regulator/RsmH inhibitor MraZ
MFELENFEIYVEDNVHKIKYWIRNNTDKEMDTVLNFVQLPFRTYTRLFPLKLGPNGCYWVSTTLREIMPDENAGQYWGMFCGVDLEIKVNDVCVYKIPLPWTITNNFLRKGIDFNSTIHKPKFWLIGDSHANYNTKAPLELLTTEKYDIVPVSIQALSLSRFLNSDWRRFFNTIPIWENDVISFELGDVDLRMSLFKKSKESRVPINKLMEDLINRYFKFIGDFKTLYKNKIILLIPNRTAKDGWDKENRILSTTDIRVKLWEDFNEGIRILGKLNNIEIWDYKTMYKDIDGSIINDVLIEGDLHLKVKEPMLIDLKGKINTNLEIQVFI